MRRGMIHIFVLYTAVYSLGYDGSLLNGMSCHYHDNDRACQRLVLTVQVCRHSQHGKANLMPRKASSLD